MGIEEPLFRLSAMVGGELLGEPGIRIRGVNELSAAGEGEITFISRPGMAEQAERSRAAAVIVPPGVGQVGKPAIRVKDPCLAITLIHHHFLQTPFSAAGIHPRAHISSGCRIPEAVSIGPMAVLGEGVVLGERVVIGAGAVIDRGVHIGDDCLVYPNVTIYPGCRIGNRVIIHSGAVIGGDGFGYATDGQGRHLKRPHVGTVEIEDDVEIGANVCVDRGTFGRTRIGRGSKIDNLVQLGHNVEIGENCLLVAQVGVAGSTLLGRNVVVGGQAGLAGHLQIDDRVMIAAKSGVHNHQPPGTVVAGIPAISHKKWVKAVSAFQKLPELIKDVRTLRKMMMSEAARQERPAAELEEEARREDGPPDH